MVPYGLVEGWMRLPLCFGSADGQPGLFDWVMWFDSTQIRISHHSRHTVEMVARK